MQETKPRWIYWKKTFHSKFQAGCLKAKLEENWHNGYELGPLVEIRNNYGLCSPGTVKVDLVKLETPFIYNFEMIVPNFEIKIWAFTMCFSFVYNTRS